MLLRAAHRSSRSNAAKQLCSHHVVTVRDAQLEGAGVCGNRLVLPLERIDEAVLGTLSGDVLKPAIIEAVIARVLDAMMPAAMSRESKRCHAEFAAIDREIARLTEAIAVTTTDLPTLLSGRAGSLRTEESTDSRAMRRSANC